MLVPDSLSCLTEQIRHFLYHQERCLFLSRFDSDHTNLFHLHFLGDFVSISYVVSPLLGD